MKAEITPTARRVEDADGRIRVEFAPLPEPAKPSLLQSGIIRLEGTINSDDISAARVRQVLREWPAGKPIVVAIDSAGGHIAEAVAIFNALKLDPRHVTVQIRTQAASSGAVIAMAADRIEIAPLGSIAIHCARFESVGTATAVRLRAMAEQLEEADAQMLDIFAHRLCSKHSRGWILKALLDERIFIGNDAVADGFADLVNEELQNA